MTIDDLNRRFALPGIVRVDEGCGGLTRIVVTHATATGEVYLHGAHVAAWQPTGSRPVLWMSQNSLFQPDKPIRGGVPICFPWFGAKANDPAAPAHGVARISEWRIESISQDDAGVTVRLKADLASYDVTYTVRFGRELRMSLAVHNAGSSSVSFEAALHTYLAVSDIHRVRVRGLEAMPYLDQLAARRLMPATGIPIAFEGETDRIYRDAGEAVTVVDEPWRRTIRIAKQGSRSTVVWNPWDAKAARMPDFGDNEWPAMLCVETANIGDDAIDLPAGKSHEMVAVMRVEGLA